MITVANLLRRYRDAITEGWDSEPNDWRAWITADGQLQEVVGDVTHAEYVTGHFNSEDDDPMDDDYVDAALSRALQAGWIRVGINLDSHEFFATCDAKGVTRAALIELSRVMNARYAAEHTLDVSGTFYRGKAQIKKTIARLRMTK
jgi:hypothetical protein